MAYNLRTNEILLHGKFQPPNFNGVAVHRSQTEVQTKRGLSNILTISSQKFGENVRLIDLTSRAALKKFRVFP